VVKGTVRFKINKSIWETGKTIEEFLKSVKAKRGSSWKKQLLS